jgi:hypothetical protein
MERKQTFGVDKVSNNFRLIAGLFSLFLLGLIVIGPLYLSEKLEAIETSQSGVISFDELISEMSVNETLMGYEPYLELNTETENHHYVAPFTQVGVYFIDYSTYRGMSILTYNSDGYVDEFISSRVMTQSPTRLIHQMEVDLDQWLIDGADEFYFMFQYPGDYFLQDVYFRGFTGEDAYGGAFQWITYPSEYLTPTSGMSVFTFDISQSDILDGISECELAGHIALIVQIELSSPYVANTQMYSNLQINPGYFELTESEVSWDNQTVTSYTPFISSVSGYAVHKVSMGLGGILILGFGWIASPFNKNFNNFIPVNAFKKYSKFGRGK